MHQDQRAHSQSGFTLIELALVIGLMGILSSMAVMQVNALRPVLIGDGGMRMISAELTYAREMAIAQRRQIEISFVGNAIRVTRREVPNGTTLLREVPFESGVTFSIPQGTPDTPDRFGNDAATTFSGAATVMFTTDGSLISNTGTPVNGSIYMLAPGEMQSLRAVTILGTTGRVRSYRWTGTAWRRV